MDYSIMKKEVFEIDREEKFSNELTFFFNKNKENIVFVKKNSLNSNNEIVLYGGEKCYEQFFQEFKEYVNDNNELKFFFENQYKICDIIEILTDYFTELDEKFKKFEKELLDNNKHTNDEVDDSIIEVGKNLLLENSLAEGKFKMLTMIKSAKNEVLNNTISKNKVLLKNEDEDFYNTLKKINFINLLDEYNKHRIRFSHGKLHFYVRKTQSEDILENMKLLVEAMKDFNAIQHSIIEYIRPFATKLIPDYPLCICLTQEALKEKNIYFLKNEMFELFNYMQTK